MKQKITLTLLCLLFIGAAFAQQERNCHSMNNLEYRESKDPSLKQRMKQIESFTQRKIQENQNYQSKVDGQIITIPVVVHVIYKNSQENISAAQIQSQIDVLNEDFRRTNADANNIWSQAADTQIEFKLATIDVNGNPTTGITRKSSTKTSWGTNDAMKKSSQGGVNPWDATQYLNMWVCNIGGGILGYAQFPGGSVSTDGVVMSPQYFGSSDKGSGFYLSAPFDKGRTATHEVGHFLNLRHIWGDGGCGVDDFVSDTPESDASNGGCVTNHVSCGSVDMVQNYMDYSNDSCMNLFTLGQKNRMRTILESGGSRRSLALSDKFGAGTPPTGTNYCTSKGASVADEYIQKVALGSINNTSAGGNGYSDFTSVSTSLFKGEENTITITPRWTGTLYNEGYGVFIDYNQDGDFSDAGEIVYTKAPSKTTPVVGSFTVPASAVNGETRMRIVLKYNATPTACEASFQYGEVEDYTVVIEEAQADTTAPSAPSSLTASNIEETSLTLNWSASTDNVGVTGYDVYRGSTLLGSTTATTTNITGLTAGTSYTFTVRAKDAENNISNASNVLNVSTLAIVLNYCDSKGNRSTYEWIDNVELGGMTNATAGNGGYGDFTNKVATLGQGSSNSMVVSAGFASTAYTEYWAVWIDFNQDGTFADSEKVISGSSSSANNLTATVVVPSNATLGQTRMRVSMKYNAAQTSCETFADGEVEDYTVNIVSVARQENPISGERLGSDENINLMVYPNPAVNTVEVKFASKADNITYRIVNVIGRVVQTGRLDSSKINVSSLNTGMYILEVNDGQKSLTTKLLKK